LVAALSGPTVHAVRLEVKVHVLGRRDGFVLEFNLGVLRFACHPFEEPVLHVEGRGESLGVLLLDWGDLVLLLEGGVVVRRPTDGGCYILGGFPVWCGLRRCRVQVDPPDP